MRDLIVRTITAQEAKEIAFYLIAFIILYNIGKAAINFACQFCDVLDARAMRRNVRRIRG